MNPKVANRLWSRVHVPLVGDPDACWRWTGNTTPKGYGLISVDNQQTYVHRLVYSEAKGQIPKGKVVMHTCDVRNCVNPDHLLVGTFADNSLDMVHKDRLQRGARHRRTLTDNRTKTSRFVGVSKSTGTRKWKATVIIQGKNRYLGVYETEEEAAQAYQDALDAYYRGEY